MPQSGTNDKGQATLDGTNLPSDADAYHKRTTLACHLLALTAQEREQHAQVTEQLRGKVLARKELADGYAFQFAAQADTLHLLAGFVTHEVKWASAAIPGARPPGGGPANGCLTDTL